MPSITNGQRMKESVAPTSFMTSTSRRRENRLNLDGAGDQQDRGDDQQDRESAPIASFTTRVAVRILVVSSSCDFNPVDRAIDRHPPPAAAVGGARTLRKANDALSGLSGVTRKVSGSGLVPSEAQASGLRFFSCA